MKLVIGLLLLSTTISASENPPYWDNANWSEGHIRTLSNRKNIYQLPQEVLAEFQEKGKIHALSYPVEVTGLLIPYYPFKRVLESDSRNPVRRIFSRIGREVSGFESMDDMYAWLGLHEYPNVEGSGVYRVPYPTGRKPDDRMGASLIERDGAKGLTFSCAACHSSNPFGKKIIRLTNRFPRANEYFHLGKKFMPAVPAALFGSAAGANKAERKMYKETRKNLPYITVKKPLSIGLDTSLAQVGLSLAKRADDEYATKTKYGARNPRPSELDKNPADSKPAVWWNLKYKNRWLSDGSVVSGNPIYTNFLWNEIGRGTDLKELETWLENNKQKVMELTTAVFATEAPRYEEFFGADSIDLEMAKRGEHHYKSMCMKCHGAYKKGWSGENSDELSQQELIQTLVVKYPKKTKVIDLGTDPYRYKGMEAFAKDLNKLKISKTMGTVVKPQKGYVPPPLVGIWARWPYFHNNSVPSLCALLSPASERPKTFWMGEAKDAESDFDQDCVGYPTGDAVPTEWKKDQKYLFNTNVKGLSNSGHDERIFIKNGEYLLSGSKKRELIEFLKTL